MQWFQGLPPDHREARYKQVMNWMEDPVTKLFFEVMRKDEEASLADVPCDDPNWVVKQAYVNGQRRMLHKLERLTQKDE